MTQTIDQKAQVADAGSVRSRRTDFLDQIRLVLTCLVILHHSAIMFGAPGGWYLQYPTEHLVEQIGFTVFVSINQAFFMGFFFLLSGYFSVASFDRKGPLRFLGERLVRLGMPILVYGYVLGPMTIALAEVREGAPFLENWRALVVAGHFNIGPLWFALALLLLSLAYVLWRMAAPACGRAQAFMPRPAHLLAAALATGALAFLLRLWVPVGQERWMLQIGYFGSYVVLFAAGCATARGSWLEQIDARTARAWRLVAWICGPLLFVYGLVAGKLSGAPFDTSGGWTLPALAYAFWEPLVAWGIILGMLARFRLTSWRALRPSWSSYAYAAYIVHPPVVVALGLLLAPAKLPNSLDFAMVGLAAILLSFVLARLILQIPGAKRIL